MLRRCLTLGKVLDLSTWLLISRMGLLIAPVKYSVKVAFNECKTLKTVTGN